MDEVYKASTMSSGKEYTKKKKRIFSKKYFIGELKDAGALKIKTVNGVEQMALKKVSDMTVGLVIAAKGTKSFPDSVILKWIKSGSKLTKLLVRQFLMYDHLVKFLGAGVHEDDIEKWKNLLRSNKYIWPEENDGWSSIFGNETFLNFQIIPVELLSKDFCSKESNVSESDILNKDDLFSKHSHRNDSKKSHRSDSKKSHRSDSKKSHHSKSKKYFHSDSDIENEDILLNSVNKKDVLEKDHSKDDIYEFNKDQLKEKQKENSEETLYKSVNDANEVSKSENNIFRDPKENSLQRLSIEYTEDAAETDYAKDSEYHSENNEKSLNQDIIENYDENSRKNSTDKKESDNMNVTEDFSENNNKSLNQGIIEKYENDSKNSSEKKDLSMTIQYEEKFAKENTMEKLPSDQYDEICPKMDINDLNTDDERRIFIQDVPNSKIENMETESVPTNKPLSEIIIKKKRKKRLIEDDDISDDKSYKSYRVVILPEEDIQCSFCERITHTIDNCPERKRLKTLQNRTVWDRISVKRPRPKCLNVQKTNSDLSNLHNTNSTFSVLKCATGSKYLYKTKVEKTTDTLNSSKNIDLYTRSQVNIYPNPVKPFISNKWHKPIKSPTKTISMKCDVEKKKKELLSKQIKELKELLNLFTNKKSDMSLEVKKTLLETIKSLQTSIDNIRQQLNNNLDKKQSSRGDSDSMAYKTKKEKEHTNTKIQQMEDESEKEKKSLSPERIPDQASMEVQQLQNGLGKEKSEELKDSDMLSSSLRHRKEDEYLPNLLPSPGRSPNNSSLKVQKLENKPENEKIEELGDDTPSPSSRQKSEDEYSLNLVLSPESMRGKSPDKNVENSTVE